MSSNPSQDLIFFKDNSLISSDILASPYAYLSTITYNQSTSPTWLVNSLIETSLVGSANLVNTDLKRVANRSKVTVISFVHNKEQYVLNCKKNIDLEHNGKNFTFVDYFTKLFTELIKDPENASMEVGKLFDVDVMDGVVFLENPEILLYGTSITSDELLFNIMKLNKKCKQLFVISAKGENVVNNDALLPTDPGFKESDFLIKLFHRSQLNISLQPLNTGRAKDITGSLTVSKGAIPYYKLPNLKINEREYVYNVTKDSQIKLYYR
ncbi:Elongator complex protein 6 [Candida viswanathii]|uniref:Elongator complex protein 6 n=1 Tax=Candida viswanathii TaxID=5486 RepID=A0A367Y101_9ASCO|nr:Elongator complex protein 6 [Candida viswanathii]